MIAADREFAAGKHYDGSERLYQSAAGAGGILSGALLRSGISPSQAVVAAQRGLPGGKGGQV